MRGLTAENPERKNPENEKRDNPERKNPESKNLEKHKIQNAKKSRMLPLFRSRFLRSAFVTVVPNTNKNRQFKTCHLQGLFTQEYLLNYIFPLVVCKISDRV